MIDRYSCKFSQVLSNKDVIIFTMNYFNKIDLGIISIILTNLYLLWSVFDGNIQLKELMWIHLWSILLLSFLYCIFIIIFGRLYHNLGKSLLAYLAAALSIFIIGFIFFVYSIVIAGVIIELTLPHSDVNGHLVFSYLKIIILSHIVSLVTLRIKSTDTTALQKKWASFLFAEGIYSFLPFFLIGAVTLLVACVTFFSSYLGYNPFDTKSHYYANLLAAAFIIVKLLVDIDVHNMLQGKKTWVLPNRTMWDKNGKLK